MMPAIVDSAPTDGAALAMIGRCIARGVTAASRP